MFAAIGRSLGDRFLQKTVERFLRQAESLLQVCTKGLVHEQTGMSAKRGTVID
jgi:hypothetical protein